MIMIFFYSVLMLGTTLLVPSASAANAPIYRNSALQPSSLGHQRRIMPSQSNVSFNVPMYGSNALDGTLNPPVLATTPRHKRTNSSSGHPCAASSARAFRKSGQVANVSLQVDSLQEVLMTVQPSLMGNDIAGTLCVLQSYADAQRYDILLSLARQQELLTRILMIAQEDHAQTSSGLACFKLFDQAAEALSEVAPWSVKVGYQCLKCVVKGLGAIVEKSCNHVQEVKSGEWTDKSGNNMAHLAAKNYSPRLTAWCLVNCVPEVFQQVNQQGFTPYQLAEVKKTVFVKAYEAAVQKKEDKAEARAERLAAKAERKEAKRRKKSEKGEKLVSPEAASAESSELPAVKVAAKYKRKIRKIEEVLALLAEVQPAKGVPDDESLTSFPSLKAQVQSQGLSPIQSQILPSPFRTSLLAHSCSADKLAPSKQVVASTRQELEDLRIQLDDALNLVIERVEQSAETIDGETWRMETLGFLTDLNEGQKLLLEILTEQMTRSSSE